MTPSVAILVPVLGRPHRVIPTIESVSAATSEPYRLLFVANSDDQAELEALEAAGADTLVVPPERHSWAMKVNDGYRATTEEWVFTGADDLAFHPGWFPRALRWATERTGVIGTNDGGNPRVMTGAHSTHSLVRRSYADDIGGVIDQPSGVVVNESYPHSFADDELVQTAMARGVYVHAFDSDVEHLHYLWGKGGGMDDTYRLGAAGHRRGKQMFLRRRRLWSSVGTRAAASTPPVEGAPPGPKAVVMRAVVVTACYGGVDTQLHRQATQDIPVDWVCFTDEPAIVQAPAPWRVVHAPPRYDHPCLAAKVHKMTPDVDYTDVVWVDANTEVTSHSFVREALAARHDGVAVFAHPRRPHAGILEEAVASLGDEGQDGKYAGQPLMEQVAAYHAEGHPEHGEVYACGVVAWDFANPKAVEVGKAWLAECERWSWQDQLSLPVVCRRLGVVPGVFPVRQIERSKPRVGLTNRWLVIHNHTFRAPDVSSAPAGQGAAGDAIAMSSGSTASGEERPELGVSVLIPYASTDDHRAAALAYVLAWYARHHPAWEVILEGCDGPWSKGRALHAAAARATHDTLVLADADSIVPPDALREAVLLTRGGTGWVMPHRRVYRLSREHTARVYAGAEPAPRDVCRPVYTGVTGGGITVLTRAAWDTIGGIDPRFEGWGGEDLAAGWALETLCGPGTHLEAPFFHLWHEQLPQGTRRRGSPASEALAGRYRQARGKPEAMRALVAEHAPVGAPA